MSTYYDDEFDPLKGKHILSVEWTESTMRFNLKHDAVLFHAVGDCCSQSFIESLDDQEVFNNSIFESVESIQGEQKDVDGEVHAWTFYKFKTSKGMCTLSFRNESNGYYDGHLERDKSWSEQ